MTFLFSSCFNILGIEADLKCSVNELKCTDSWEQVKGAPTDLTEEDMIKGLTCALPLQTDQPQATSSKSKSSASSKGWLMKPKFLKRIFSSSRKAATNILKPEDGAATNILKPEDDARLRNVYTYSKEKGPEKKMKRTIRFWDFGGQIVYFILHYIFLRTHCIYILVVNLSRPCDALVKIPRNLGKLAAGLQAEDAFVEVRYFEQVMSWLNMILTSLKLFGDKESPCVILVGTHKDLLHENKEEQKKLADAYFSDLTSRFNKAQSDLLLGNAIAVDSKHGDANFDKLRELIIESIDAQYEGRQFRPVKWLQLEKCLYEYSLATSSYDHKLISFEKCKEMASEYKMSSNEDIMVFLEYHHLTGDLTFFREDSLNQFFIIDSQWLIDVIRAVITLEVFHEKCPLNVQPQLRLLHTEGILEPSGSLLKFLWSPLFKSDSGKSQIEQRHIDHLLALMAKFDLIVKHGEVFIVQCFLPISTDDDIAKKLEGWKAIVCPIYFRFHSSKRSYGNEHVLDDHFLPYGLFLKLMSRCAKHTIEGSRWVKIECMYQNAVIYRHEDMKLILQASDNAVSVSLLGNKDCSTKKVQLSEIWSILFEIIKGLLADYHPNMWFEMCVKPCKDHPTFVGVGVTSEGDMKLHHAPCPSCDKAFYLQAFSVWFKSITLEKLTHSKLWDLAQMIPDENYRTTLGFELDIPDNVIAKCATDHPCSIWEASYEMLSHWFNMVKEERKACVQLCEALNESGMARLVVDIGLDTTDE